MTTPSIKIFNYLKKFSPFFFSILVLGVLFYPNIAQAWPWDALVGAVMKIPNTIVLVILVAFTSLIGLIATAMGGLMNFVLSPDFISLSYTNPGGPHANLIIDTGLKVTQSFVNMALVLILIYIALATILRLGGAKTQKLLATLIIVALLVNFAPVLIGLVVDASNIIMNYFTSKLTGFSSFLNRMQGLWDAVKGIPTTINITEQLSDISQAVVILVLNCILVVFFGLYTLIFIARYVAIWLIVILSPLAFVAYILPQTKKFFDLWLNQLLQWSFIGVTAGFFLYLSERVSEILWTRTEGGVPVIDYQSTSTIFDNILPSIVIIVFIIVGFILSLKTGAMGTTVVMKAVEKGSRATGKSLAKSSWSGTRKIYSAPFREAGRVAGQMRRDFRQREDNKLDNLPMKSNLNIIKGAFKKTASYKTASKTARIVTKGAAQTMKAFEPAVKDYESARSLGYGRLTSLGEGVGRWGKEVKNAPHIKFASKGISKALKTGWGAEALKAGWGAATGKPKTKKYIACKNCGKDMPADAESCTVCNTKF
ncbi:hypothetical protein ACFLYY_00465 [Patescibacteria group bacterium]